jgi:hypothetical protein
MPYYHLPESDELAQQIADVFELVMHDFQEAGISVLPQPGMGITDHGIIRLNLDDAGRLVVRVIEGAYDSARVKATLARHRKRRG